MKKKHKLIIATMIVFLFISIIFIYNQENNLTVTFANSKSSYAAIVNSSLYDQGIQKSTRNIYNLSTFIVAMFSSFTVMYCIYFKYGREYSVGFNDEYYHNITNKYTPAETAYLVIGKTPDSSTLVATLLNLILKGYLKLEYIKNDIDDKKIVNLKFIVTKKNNYNELKKHENFLINLLIYEIGNDHSFESDWFKNINKDNKHSIRFFKKKYQEWIKYVEEDSFDENFFEDSKKPFILSLIFGAIFIFIGFLGIFMFQAKSFIFFIIAAVLTAFYGNSIKRRTEFGQEEYEKWLAYKRYIRNLDTLKSTEINTLDDLENHLVYSIALNVYRELLKNPKENINIDNANINDTNIERSKLFYFYSNQKQSFESFLIDFSSTIDTFINNLDLYIDK